MEEILSAMFELKFFPLAGALMEEFLEGRAPLRLYEVKSEGKICI